MARRSPLLFGTIALALTLSVARPALADALERFLRHTADPRNFSAENYHPDFQSETVVNGETLWFDRETLADFATHVRSQLSDFEILRFNLTEREERDGQIWIAGNGRYAATVDGERIEVETAGTGVVVPGGPLGYRWLVGVGEERIVESQ
ncbi:MAG: hypothetical protein QNJ94_21925 [Alphaproteobacteria bacterium]|nr:hypothetical protein [Alphaproteobacteria bacterium]